jgi:hypothetical protein
MQACTFFMLPALLAGLVLGAPSDSRQLTRHVTTAADIILAIMPNSSSCSGAAYADECRTASEAAPYVIHSFANFTVYAPAQIAACLAYMAYESGQLEYKKNHYPAPGRPGQGTAIMMMPNYVAMYAGAIFGASATASGDVSAILDLVMDDKYNFGAPAWFLTSQCPDAKRQLATDAEGGWAAFMTCAGVSVTEEPERTTYWTAAKKEFGLS